MHGDNDLQHYPLKELMVLPKVPTMINWVTGKTWLITTCKQLTEMKGHTAYNRIFNQPTADIRQ